MNKTKIEWCDSTWNPVTGCLHGCEYCYARKMARRFSYEGETLDAPPELQRTWIKDSKGSGAGNHVLRYPVDTVDGRKVPYPFGFAPTFHRYRLTAPDKLSSPRTVFVCSMADLFGDWVPDSWIEEVFAACRKAPQHRYLFLTKNPQRYADLAKAGKLPKRRECPDFWYGSTVTKASDKAFMQGIVYNTFLSIEPLFEPLHAGLGSFGGAEFIIIGAETGNRKDKVTPKKEWVDEICEAADGTQIAVFMKDSLIPIVGEGNMRREFPWKKERRKENH